MCSFPKKKMFFGYLEIKTKGKADKFISVVSQGEKANETPPLHVPGSGNFRRNSKAR